ncbi:MAG: type toxin-antitoxin system HicB family antitoxin [Candidatus Solibacter sp.]|jgi:antitoxin HicB|nr:type toxin-antitoxin system HicB family antitoxin [Candidatus Solibacter sp.]
MEYPAKFEPGERGGFVVSFPDFDWGVTQGDSEQDAREMALDALLTMITVHIRRGEDVPRPSRPRGRKYRIIRLPALQAAKTELYQAFSASGIRKAELARRMGISKVNVDRLFDLKHQSRLDQLESAFKALGKDMAIQIRDAA